MQRAVKMQWVAKTMSNTDLIATSRTVGTLNDKRMQELTKQVITLINLINNRDIIQATDYLYKKLDDFIEKEVSEISSCTRGCHYCCNFSVTISYPEAVYIEHKTGIKPDYKYEVARTDYREPCTFLKNNECSIYEYRPAVCRVYTSVDDVQLCIDDKSHNMIALSPPGVEGDKTFINVIYWEYIIRSLEKYSPAVHVKDIRQFFKGDI